ncbi:CDP-glycerol glycerophosphotransferase [Scopulibacillus darangshiensis]|uniref:CDP-glycerol glycerophosphotransferase n=1 Tax=Scopulibacillus darangshiensis TaxID=442528 RepID=A0A4R2NKF3_9BACL|nr:CDP-glycerol glycerophosphotransferase family protein [Scopulibacillus darangshiensis]TCP21862.1 CDP-glycerol glycerophosphotransferase [Scopulibacillus darangshiensis]
MGFLTRVKNKLQSGVKRSNKNNLKKHLVVKQQDHKVEISGSFSRKSYQAKELWIKSRDNGYKAKLAEIEPSAVFQFNINLHDVMRHLDDEASTFDFYVKIRTRIKHVSEERLGKVKANAEYGLLENGEPIIEYFIRFGRFEDTKIKNPKKVVLDDRSLVIYTTKNGNMSLAHNTDLNPVTTNQIKSLKIKSNHLIFNGKLLTGHSRIEDAYLIMNGRDTNAEKTFPFTLNLKENYRKNYGLHQYHYFADIDLAKTFRHEVFKEDIYDFSFCLKYHDQDEMISVRVGNPRLFARHFVKGGFIRDGKETFAISPYFTFKQFNLSIQVDQFDGDVFKYMRTIKRWSWLLRPFYSRKNIWLVGERAYKAQDTGYHFFKYLREEHPERNVYYVIDKTSPEYRNVEPLGQTIDFKSRKHIFYALMAKRIIGSHHPDYLYPLRTKEFKRAVKATKVFLQHGIMGTKNMVANYGKNSPGFDTDLFLVSSDFEKNMIVQDFGYDPSEVKITGLSRFDQLLTNQSPKRQILIIPTWRDWIVTEDTFLESDYFERYKQLVNHPTLHKLATDYGFDIIFCLHPNMQKFTPYFTSDSVRVVNQGEVDVQHLLKESRLMITDYSSVGFDFSFLHKPIIYYQFDRERFIGQRPSHLDLDNDLPGDIVSDQEDVLACIEDYAKSHFRMKDHYKERANKFLKYRDCHANDRIYKTMVKFKPKRQIIKELADNDYFRTLYRKYRKSKLYFPTMRLFYNIARRVLPVDDKLVLFESGIGKQYADSPRYIYEELVKRGLDYKKVWVYNDNIRFKDSDTVRIERLSPKYYYYLARAKYWVNNQNFPTYIEKRKGTTYIQTWHGTPLKKMLFDIDNIQGRDADYLERVSKATSTWDFLVSPSPYATKAFLSAFHYKKKVLEIGYPRNDLFYRPDINEKAAMIRRRLTIPKDKKVILYAPTFRDNQKGKGSGFTFDINLDFEKMKKQLGDDYVLLLRMHVVVKNKISIPEEYQDFVYNASDYPDIQELYLISDILMTDYSSVMFDFANLKRPILFYTYDLEVYRDQLRGFYMDFEKEAPGPFLRNTDEIIEAVLGIEEIRAAYHMRYVAFYNKFCSLEDGYATERLVDNIFAKQNKGIRSIRKTKRVTFPLWKQPSHSGAEGSEKIMLQANRNRE